QALAVSKGADWPVLRAAMEAILRRVALASQDDLRVASRPKRGGFGTYTTKKRRGPARPYLTSLSRLDPLRASCDCDDFLRNSLGLCKHVIVVLEDLARSPRRVAQSPSPATARAR